MQQHEQTERFQLEQRAFTFRAKSVDVDKRVVRGIAVPYDTPVRIRDWFDEYDEQFARGSVDDDGALAFWRHSEPIGVLTEATEADAGREVALQISDTVQGRDALTLARDFADAGRPMELSIGFESDGDYTVTERGNGEVPLITRTRVKVREVSLVPFGAYGPAAGVTDVRSHRKEFSMTTTAPAAPAQPITTEPRNAGPDTVELRETVDRLERSVQRIETGAFHRDEGPARDTRSAGAVLKAIVAGDEDTIRSINELQERIHDEQLHREYTGGTTADAPVKDGWVGDLTRIFDSSSGVLARVLSTGTLPATGMNIEYAELASNNITVAEQSAQGDPLSTGKVTLTTKTAAVKTYGGAASLSRQAIERSTLPVLNRTMEALAVAAGARKKAVLRAAWVATVTARENIAANGGVVVLGATLAAGTAGHWEDALVDASIKYDDEDAAPEALIVSASVFKKLRSLTVSGERVFTVYDRNHSGSLNLPGLSGNLASIPVYLDAGQSGDKAAFVNGRAIRQYDSAVVSLQDENILNLTRDFSVYRYGAVAAEIPQFIVPVKLAAS